MAEGGSGYIRLYVFIMVLGLTFPTLGYTFTTFGGSPEQYDISIDSDLLLLAGISLQQAESQNVSWNGGYVYFPNLNDTNMRVAWQEWAPGPLGLGVHPHGLRFQRQVWGFYWGHLGIQIPGSDDWQFYLYNETIVNEWDDNYNWSRFELRGLAWNLFITPPSHVDNITDAVYENGIVTATLGRVVNTDAGPNWRTFIDWYFGVLVGSNDWGLPSVFNWVIRIISGLSMLSAVLLAKEVISL